MKIHFVRFGMSRTLWSLNLSSWINHWPSSTVSRHLFLVHYNYLALHLLILDHLQSFLHVQVRLILFPSCTLNKLLVFGHQSRSPVTGFTYHKIQELKKRRWKETQRNCLGCVLCSGGIFSFYSTCTSTLEVSLSLHVHVWMNKKKSEIFCNEIWIKRTKR